MNIGRWRHHVIKHYRNRAEQFMQKAQTPEEKKAWEEVVYWFDSILSHRKRDSRDQFVLEEERMSQNKMTREQTLEILKLQSKLDRIIQIIDLWNLKQITPDEAFTRFFQYITYEDIQGMRKRFELMRSSVPLTGAKKS